MSPTKRKAEKKSSGDDEQMYKKESIEILKHSFQRLSVKVIQDVFRFNGFIFSPSYKILNDIKTLVIESPLNRQDLIQHIKEAYPFSAGYTVLLQGNRRGTCFPQIDSRALREELSGIPELQGKTGRGNNPVVHPTTKVGRLKDDKADPIAADNFRSPLKERGNVPEVAFYIPPDEEWQRPEEPEISCECCFCDYAFEEMVACSEGVHLFCKTCVNGYAKEELYGKNRSELKCMSTDNCCGTYSSQMIQKALSPKTMKNFAERSYREAIDETKLENIWTCPKCDYLGILDATDAPFVECPGCQHQSCPLCKEDPHKDKTCEQAKLENEESNASARIATKMTEAVVRSCPGCKTSIVKLDNATCNKMTCPNKTCGTKFCYVCRQAISDYSHFCRTPHCTHESCGMCVLFTNAEEDDRRARRDAGQREKEALGVAAENVALLSPEEKKPKAKAPPERSAFDRNLLGWAGNNAPRNPVAQDNPFGGPAHDLLDGFRHVPRDPRVAVAPLPAANRGVRDPFLDALFQDPFVGGFQQAPRGPRVAVAPLPEANRGVRDPFLDALWQAPRNPRAAVAQPPAATRHVRDPFVGGLGQAPPRVPQGAVAQPPAAIGQAPRAAFAQRPADFQGGNINGYGRNMNEDIAQWFNRMMNH